MSGRAPRALSSENYALFCDEYELTMAQSFWWHGENRRAAFELTVRTLPPQRGFLVAAGLEQALAYLCGLHFDAAELKWLRSAGYDPGFVEMLGGLRFTGDVDAVPEGTVIGAGVPLLRVVAPRIEATLVESALLAIVNHQTMIASKAARIVEAAAGRPVWDFSMRRLHGPDAALGVARAAFIGGAAGTATTVAGQRLGIPTTGTMAHHYVLGFGPDGEQAAFEQFLADYPARAVLLVDTYDTPRGVERAIAASRTVGVPLAGVRIDSGDIAALSRQARALLDAAGMAEAGIIASGDLDEHRIAALLDSGAAVDSFGVGTMLGTSADAPSLQGIYKLVAQEIDRGMLSVMKWSTHKATDPGMHQVWRGPTADLIGLHDEVIDGEPLLQPGLRTGEPVAASPSLTEIRDRAATQMRVLPQETRRLTDPVPLAVQRSAQLVELRSRLSGGRVGV